MRECCWQVEAEAVSNSRNRLHKAMYIQVLFPGLSIYLTNHNAILNLWRMDTTTYPALKHAVTQEETRTEKEACSSQTATVAAAVQTVSDKLAMMEHTTHT